MNFQKIDDMLPSELAVYARTLETEIKSQAKALTSAKSADTFIFDGQDKFQNREDMMASLEVGDVRLAQSFIAVEESYIVKLSGDRIDSYKTAIEAEGIAMLHRVD